MEVVKYILSTIWLFMLIDIEIFIIGIAVPIAVDLVLRIKKDALFTKFKTKRSTIVNEIAVFVIIFVISCFCITGITNNIALNAFIDFLF